MQVLCGSHLSYTHHGGPQTDASCSSIGGCAPLTGFLESTVRRSLFDFSRAFSPPASHTTQPARTPPAARLTCKPVDSHN
ncbi:hypothetical protein M3J09_006581 [Ascochyta lentis]